MKQLYNYIGTGLLALSFSSFISCTEIEHGVNDIDSWEDVKDYTEKLNHPCMLHTQADFDFVKSKIAEKRTGFKKIAKKSISKRQGKRRSNGTEKSKERHKTNYVKEQQD